MVQSLGGEIPDPPVCLPRHHHHHHHHRHHSLRRLQIPDRGQRSEAKAKPHSDLMSRLESPEHPIGHRATLGHGTSSGGTDAIPVIRLLVLGGHGVGKSAITVRYLTRRFIGEYKSQVDIIYRQTLQVDKVKIDLEIIDISSRPGDDTLPTLEICQCDCYLVVYSVADRHTFVTANQLLHAIFKLRPNVPCPPITLLGNKQDLEHSRQVASEEGDIVSRTFGCAFFEVSAAETSEDIVPIFTALIKRARMASFLCPHSSRNRLDHSRICPCSCHRSLLTNNNTCTKCRCKGVLLSRCATIGGSGSRSVSMREQPKRGSGRHEPNATDTRQSNGKPHRKTSRSNSKKQAVRSLSSPVPRASTDCHKTPQDNSTNQRKCSNSSVKQTCPHVSKSESDESTKPKDQSQENYLKVSEIRHFAVLCRSLSSPDSWPELNTARKSSDQERSRKPEPTLAVPQEPNLLTRGRSFVFDNRVKDDRECPCGSQHRTSSFKSSGKVEIVNIRKPKVNLTPNFKPASDKEDEAPKDRKATDSTRQEEPRLPSPASNSSPKTSKSTQKLPSLNLDSGTVDDSCATASGGRQRKFSVFGVGRALGNFLSKGSMPDLPRATANICDRFGSLKKTIKKRSV